VVGFLVFVFLFFFCDMVFFVMCGGVCFLFFGGVGGLCVGVWVVVCLWCFFFVFWIC